LQAFSLTGRKEAAIDLPGRPRWCVTDAAAARVFLCIREPSMVLVAGLPELNVIARWKLPSAGAHGLDIDHSRGRLYAACDDGTGTGAHTTVLVPPDRLYVISPAHGGILVLADA
jgi:hypothetical protein